MQAFEQKCFKIASCLYSEEILNSKLVKERHPCTYGKSVPSVIEGLCLRQLSHIKTSFLTIASSSKRVYLKVVQIVIDLI